MSHHSKPSLEDIIFWALILCGIGLAWMLIKGLVNIVMSIVLRLSQAKKQERVNEIFNSPDID